ncbi:PHD finger protein 7, partial [Megadyptes antipodes antipodes]
CGLCRRTDCDPEVLGQLCHHCGLCVHEDGLYHASGLSQRGADEEGFYGFLFPDIRQELKRVAQKRCCICCLRGASVTCRGRRCPRIFHFPCGSERGCVSQFFGEFKSFWKHRTVQWMRAVQQDQTLCLICQEAVVGWPCYGTLVCADHLLPPWVLVGCSPRPRCEALPCSRRDAAWEEDGAFADHYQRHSSCDASQCLCPAGRQQAEVNGPWRLLLCSSCGSRGTHQLCSAVGEDADSWECGDCSDTGTGEGCSSGDS